MLQQIIRFRYYVHFVYYLQYIHFSCIQTWRLGSAPVKNHGLVLDCHFPLFQSPVSRSHVNQSPVVGKRFSTDTSIGSREALKKPLKAVPDHFNVVPKDLFCIAEKIFAGLPDIALI